MDCRDFEERWIEWVDGLAGPPEGEPGAHLERCEDCAGLLARLASAQAGVRLLRALPRRAVPPDLEGRVVAALYDGYRQDRAVDFVRRLGRRRSPAELEEMLERRFRRTAPAELDRRVREELADPARALARRYARRLEKKAAPAELAQRVRKGLSRRPVRRSRVLSRALLGLAAAALLSVGWRTLATDGGADDERLAGWSFDVVPVDSPAALSDADPALRGLVEGFTGGLGSAVR